MVHIFPTFLAENKEPVGGSAVGDTVEVYVRRSTPKRERYLSATRRLRIIRGLFLKITPCRRYRKGYCCQHDYIRRIAV